MSILLAVVTGVDGINNISKGNAILLLVLLCLYTAGFGWSWGPLAWLIPSEIFPINIRTTGQSITAGLSFIIIFVLSQTFLTMLCHFKFGVFLFYAFWVAVMTLFIIFFLPETKGISLDSMYTIWGKHWFWCRFVKGEDGEENHLWSLYTQNDEKTFKFNLCTCVKRARYITLFTPLLLVHTFEKSMHM